MKNEIGNRYGKLIVLERAPKPEGRPKGAYWLCQCDCGKQKTVRGADLRAGNVNSCGCLLGKHSIKNEIGNKYGRLTVIAETNNREFGSVCWLCVCECGNEVIVAGDSLRSGQTQSCGCLNMEKSREANFVDRTNKQYCKLTALFIDEDKTRQFKHGVYWRCKCSCGNYTTALGTALERGLVKSCGCIKTSYGEEVIEQILQKNHINYKKEYTFPNLHGDKDIALRFDFAIFNNEQELIQLIEFDGEQHFKQVPHWGGEIGLLHRQQNDKRKNEYCQEHNIKLIRIPYYIINNIKDLKDLEIDL